MKDTSRGRTGIRSGFEPMIDGLPVAYIILPSGTAGEKLVLVHLYLEKESASKHVATGQLFSL